MKKKLLSFILAAVCAAMLTFGPAAAMAGTAQNVATVWTTENAMAANFNFGNPATTDITNLPAQVQDALGVGYIISYLMTAILYGF
jgi:hypothetical protein